MALDLLILMILTMQYTWSFWFSWCGRSKVVPFSYRTEPEKSSCPWIWCRPARRNPQKSEPRQSVYNDLMKNMPGMPACFLPVLATDTMRVLSFVGRYLPILVSLAGRVWTEWLLGLVAPIPNELLWLPMALNIAFWTIVTIIVDSLGFLGVAVQSQYFLHTELNWRNHCVLEFGAGQLEETDKEANQGQAVYNDLMKNMPGMPASSTCNRHHESSLICWKISAYTCQSCWEGVDWMTFGVSCTHPQWVALIADGSEYCFLDYSYYNCWFFGFSWCGRWKSILFAHRTELEKSLCPWVWCRPARRNPQRRVPRQGVEWMTFEVTFPNERHESSNPSHLLNYEDMFLLRGTKNWLYRRARVTGWCRS